MANDTEPAKPEPVKTTTVKLRCPDLRGQTINTRWGPVSFDADGLSELELPEDEVRMLRDIKPHSWLAEDHASFSPKAEPDPDDDHGTKPKARAKR